MAHDKYGREVLSEVMAGGGVRYFDTDQTICMGLPFADEAAAIVTFNATPPAGHISPTAPPLPADPERVNEILSAMANLDKTQQAALKKILGTLNG